MMKKLLVLMTLIVALNTTGFSQYSNATMNGAWFAYIAPQNPYGDSLMYIVFDGNGNVIDFSGFCDNVSGTYTVTAGGALSGTLICDADSYPLLAQLSSTTSGTADLGGDIWVLTKVSNEGALAGKLHGGFTTENCGTKEVDLYIGNDGVITSSAGLVPLALPVIGRVYAELGMFMGHFKTGETDGWNQVSIMGYYSNNTGTGKVGIDNTGCGITDAGFLREDVVSIKKISTKPFVTIFPNPSAGKYNINLNNLSNSDEKIKLSIINNLGEVIYSVDHLSTNIEIDLTSFASGIYTVHIQKGSQHLYNKIIKE